MNTHTRTYTLEELFLRRLQEAEEAGLKVKERAASRENSLAMTHLEDAVNRAERDITAKEDEATTP